MLSESDDRAIRQELELYKQAYQQRNRLWQAVSREEKQRVILRMSTTVHSGDSPEAPLPLTGGKV